MTSYIGNCSGHEQQQYIAGLEFLRFRQVCLSPDTSVLSQNHARYHHRDLTLTPRISTKGNTIGDDRRIDVRDQEQPGELTAALCSKPETC